MHLRRGGMLGPFVKGPDNRPLNEIDVPGYIRVKRVARRPLDNRSASACGPVSLLHYQSFRTP